MKDYTFTKLNYFASDDKTLIVVQVRAEWRHGIYGTHEQETFLLVVSAAFPNRIVSTSGIADVIDDARDFDGFFQQLNAWAVEALA